MREYDGEGGGMGWDGVLEWEEGGGGGGVRGLRRGGKQGKTVLSKRGELSGHWHEGVTTETRGSPHWSHIRPHPSRYTGW